jgi:hypothetical protein
MELTSFNQHLVRPRGMGIILPSSIDNAVKLRLDPFRENGFQPLPPLGEGRDRGDQKGQEPLAISPPPTCPGTENLDSIAVPMFLLKIEMSISCWGTEAPVSLSQFLMPVMIAGIQDTGT